MVNKDLEGLIRFHRDGLASYRFAMSPAAQALEEATIKALEELKSRDAKPAQPQVD